MSKQNEINDEIYVTLDLDDGSTVECSIITIYEAEGKDYIALQPMSGPDSETGEVYLYRYFESEDGEPSLSYIEDDAEYEAASDAFDEYLDSIEFDELVTDEEDEDE